MFAFAAMQLWNESPLRNKTSLPTLTFMPLLINLISPHFTCVIIKVDWNEVNHFNLYPPPPQKKKQRFFPLYISLSLQLSFTSACFHLCNILLITQVIYLIFSDFALSLPGMFSCCFFLYCCPSIYIWHSIKLLPPFSSLCPGENQEEIKLADVAATFWFWFILVEKYLVNFKLWPSYTTDTKRQLLMLLLYRKHRA